ncbi:MAG: DUF2764 family protein [Rikenellaceae bacterium]
MFETQYYSLVAGLKEYSLDGEAKGFDAKAIVEEIMEGVSAKDAEAVKLLYGYYDCENIISFRSGRTAHNPLGMLTREQIEDRVACDEMLPEQVAQVIASYSDSGSLTELDGGVKFEKALFGAYYVECAKSSCSFLRKWAETDRNIRNISTAVVARTKGVVVEEVVVGDGYIVDQLTKSSAADFGLRGELSYIDGLIAAINDEANMVEKEHKIDLIRWDESTDLLNFDYFNINMIMSYLVKVNIVARWAMLDPKRGRKLFEAMVGELSAKEMINKQ